MKTPIYSGLFQSDLDATGFRLFGLPSPSFSSDAATKGYVDAHAGGSDGSDARKFDVKSYGAAGDGTTDDTPGIAAALAAIPSTGGVLYFPAGHYKYNGAGLTLDRKITVEGDGGGVQYMFPGPVSGSGGLALSAIDFNSSTRTLFNVTAHGCEFKNIGLRNTSGTAPTAGAGILVSAAGDRTRYHNVSVDGFYICIDVQAGSGQNFEGCWIVAPILHGLKLRNIAVPDGGDHAISNCFICNGNGRAAISGIRIESGGGVKIINTKIVGMAGTFWTNGIDLAIGNSIVTVDLLICNCSIEAFTGSGIKCVSGAGSWWRAVLITGNQLCPIAGNSFGIVMDGTAGTLDGIVITGNYLFVGNTTSINPAISLTNCTNVVVAGNGQVGYASLIGVGAGVTFQPSYIGPDLRLSAISGGGKLQARNTSTGVWADVDQWTNP